MTDRASFTRSHFPCRARVIAFLLFTCHASSLTLLGESVTLEYGNAVLELRSDGLSKDRKLSLSAELTLRIAVEGGPDLEVQEPLPIKVNERAWGLIEESKGAFQSPAGGQRRRWEKRLVLEPLQLGNLTLPDITVRHRPGRGADWTTVRWQEEVVAIVASSDIQSGGIRGEPPLEVFPEPPPDSPSRFLPLLLAAASGAAVIGLAAWRLYRGRRKSLVPPHVRALAELDRVASTAPPADQPGWLHARVSAVVRGYVEERFGLPAPRRTTEEFLQSASLQPKFPAATLEELTTLLRECDRVKFTGEPPGPGETAAALALARKVVEGTVLADSSAGDRADGRGGP
jgi:hypothetical protein